MIVATERAIQEMVSLRKELQMPDGYLRIGISGGSSCQGFIYKLSFEEDILDDELIVISEKHEECVLLCPLAKEYIKNLEIDYSDDIENEGFVLSIPGIHGCQCGEGTCSKKK